MYFDLHNHSSHSKDGTDAIEDIILNAIDCGLDCVGITDHNYWITGNYENYRQEILSLREKYKDKIHVLAGMEISLIKLDGLMPKDLDLFDYCILEYYNLAIGFTDLVKIISKFKCRCGLAHTDIFGLSEIEGVDIPQLMAEHNIFWELNVNYDSIHHFREHQYCYDFIQSKEKQNRIRELGIELSVGFDTHNLKDYDAGRVKKACDFIQSAGLKQLKI